MKFQLGLNDRKIWRKWGIGGKWGSKNCWIEVLESKVKTRVYSMRRMLASKIMAVAGYIQSWMYPGMSLTKDGGQDHWKKGCQGAKWRRVVEESIRITAGAVFEEAKVSQKLRYSTNKVTFNMESKVNKLMNFVILKIFILRNRNLLLPFTEY